MASPLILTLLAKHHLVERDPIGSPDFLHHEGRQDVDFDSVCVKKSPPPPGFFSSTRRNFPQNVFISWFVVACRSSTYLGLLNRARKNVKKSKVVHTAILKWSPHWIYFRLLISLFVRIMFQPSSRGSSLRFTIRPFPNYLWPHFQSESCCSSFHMIKRFHSHAN